MYTYMHIYICIYARPPPRSTFGALPKTCMMNSLHTSINWLILIMQWVWSCKSCKPFKEAASQQTIDHSSKHPLFLSEEVQFWVIMQYFFQNTRFLHNMQCVINIEYCCENVQWLVIITAFLEQKLLLKENTGYRHSFLSWRQDSPLNKKHCSCKNK